MLQIKYIYIIMSCDNIVNSLELCTNYIGDDVDKNVGITGSPGDVEILSQMQRCLRSQNWNVIEKCNQCCNKCNETPIESYNTLDDLPLYRYPFIGAHDSASFNKGTIPRFEAGLQYGGESVNLDTHLASIQVFAQSKNILEQYRLGVNFFDLRIKRGYDNELHFHHGATFLNKVSEQPTFINMIKTAIREKNVIILYLSHCDGSYCDIQIYKDLIDLIKGNNIDENNLYNLHRDATPILGLDKSIADLKLDNRYIILLDYFNLDSGYDSTVVCFDDELDTSCVNSCITRGETEKETKMRDIIASGGEGNLCKLKVTQAFWQGSPTGATELPISLSNTFSCRFNPLSSTLPISINRAYKSNEKIKQYYKDYDWTANVLLLNDVNEHVPDIKLYLNYNIKIKYNIPITSDECCNDFGIQPPGQIEIIDESTCKAECHFADDDGTWDPPEVQHHLKDRASCIAVENEWVEDGSCELCEDDMTWTSHTSYINQYTNERVDETFTCSNFIGANLDGVLNNQYCGSYLNENQVSAVDACPRACQTGCGENQPALLSQECNYDQVEKYWNSTRNACETKQYKCSSEKECVFQNSKSIGSKPKNLCEKSCYTFENNPERILYCGTNRPLLNNPFLITVPGGPAIAAAGAALAGPAPCIPDIDEVHCMIQDPLDCPDTHNWINWEEGENECQLETAMRKCELKTIGPSIWSQQHPH